MEKKKGLPQINPWTQPDIPRAPQLLKGSVLRAAQQRWAIFNLALFTMGFWWRYPLDPLVIQHGKDGKMMAGWWCDVPILKNHGVRQWEGWHPIYEMENKKCLKPPTSMENSLETVASMASMDSTSLISEVAKSAPRCPLDDAVGPR